MAEYVIARAKQGCGCIRFAAVVKSDRPPMSREAEIDWMADLSRDIKRLKREGYTPEYVTESPVMGGCERCDKDIRKRQQGNIFAAAAPQGQEGAP